MSAPRGSRIRSRPARSRSQRLEYCDARVAAADLEGRWWRPKVLPAARGPVSKPQHFTRLPRLQFLGRLALVAAELRDQRDQAEVDARYQPIGSFPSAAHQQFAGAPGQLGHV